MAWVKLDDQFFQNRKARAAGPQGREMVLASWCFCGTQLNDGVFPAEDVPMIAALAQVPPDIADRLIDLNLWHTEGFDCEACAEWGQPNPVPSGHIGAHGYLERNKSRQQIVAEREKDRKRKASRSGQDSGSDSGRNPSASSRPVPSSTDTSFTSSSDLQEPVDNSMADDGLEEIPGEVWEEYARLKLEAELRHKDIPESKRGKWKATTRRNARHEQGLHALQWWRDFEVRPHELAAWLIDGQPSRHAQRRKENA